MRISLAVFDLAGTTVNDGDAVHLALQEALSAFGYTADRDEINTVMGIPKPEAIRILLETRNAAATPEAIRPIHDRFLIEMRNAYLESRLEEKPGCSEMFATLVEAGIRVAVDTGFDRGTTSIVLEKMGWVDRGLIHDSITSDEVSEGRPAPDMIRELMKRSVIMDASQVAKIGDTPADIREGRNAGCGLVIGVTHGSHTRAELAEYDADVLADNLSEVTNLILARR